MQVMFAEKRVGMLVCETLCHLEVCFPEFLNIICSGVCFGFDSSYTVSHGCFLAAWSVI